MANYASARRDATQNMEKGPIDCVLAADVIGCVVNGSFAARVMFDALRGDDGKTYSERTELSCRDCVNSLRWCIGWVWGAPQES